jgi:hypothetical protein
LKISDLKIPYIVVALLSAIAIAPMPYGFYTFLKIAVTACAGVTAFLKFNSGDRGFFVWACVALAIVFNPIIPIHLTKEIWMFLNLAVVILFGFFAYSIIKKSR